MGISRKRTVEILVCLVLFGVPGVLWFTSEIRWARINSPIGKFSSVDEYLAMGRLPGRVTMFKTNGSNFFIAYSPMDYRLAVPSGPAAYVFDESGKMVRWSGDTGDDGRFQRAYPLREQVEASIEDLRRIRFQPGAAPEPPPAAAVQESSETMNPKSQSEAPADGGGR